MPIKFYTDANIAKAVAVQLKGIDIVRCEDVGMKYADDEPHLIYAVRESRTLITGDEDFLELDARWHSQGRTHAGIIFIQHHDRENIGKIVNRLQFLHEAIIGGAASLEDDVYNRVEFLK
ncbi:MAG: DUF5615 family PIN-like protein [Aggregatilineales bacterium]